MQKDWVSELITRFELAKNGTIQINIDGKIINTTIASDIIEYFSTNRIILERMGIDVFKQFLQLISESKNEQAFNIILAKMSADDIIIRIQQNASSLNHETQTTEAFIESLKKFVISTLVPTLAKFLFTLLIA